MQLHTQVLHKPFLTKWVRFPSLMDRQICMGQSIKLSSLLLLRSPFFAGQHVVPFSLLDSGHTTLSNRKGDRSVVSPGPLDNVGILVIHQWSYGRSRLSGLEQCQGTGYGNPQGETKSMAGALQALWTLQCTSLSCQILDQGEWSLHPDLFHQIQYVQDGAPRY